MNPSERPAELILDLAAPPHDRPADPVVTGRADAVLPGAPTRVQARPALA
jgi:hypothetical protein